LWIKSYENDLIKIYNNVDFIDDLSSTRGPRGTTANLRDRYGKVAYDLALMVFDAAQQVSALYVYGSNDNLLSSYRSTSTPLSNYPEDIYSDRVAYNADVVSSYVLSDRRQMLVSSYFNQSRKRDIVRFVLKIYGKNASRKIGYVVCDVDSGSFSRIVEKYLLSDDQIVWLQPPGDRPVLHIGEPSDKQMKYYEDTATAIAQGHVPGEEVATLRGSVLFGIPQHNYKLFAFSIIPNSVLQEGQQALARNLIFIALLVLVVAAIGAAMVAATLTRPLTRICGTLERIRDGNRELRLDGLQNDEIGELGQAVNEMLDRIQALIVEEYDAKLLLKQAEYKALQAQVNPHFLYNSLDTMAGISLSQGCPEIGSLCYALSNMFRYAIDAKESLATVRSEIVNVKNYMYVMNARMNGQIVLDINVDRGILGESVPRLCLQPLVENSLLHGLRDKRGQKRLVITGEARGDEILLAVEDNGVGMGEREIERALSGNAKETLEGGASIGLRNIDCRIKLLFSEEYGIKIDSTPGMGCTVSMIIPRCHAPATTVEGKEA
jgi:sensor histidine kinase YesM